MSRAWQLTKHLVLLEVAIWRCLVRWVARRPEAPPDAVQLGYGQLVAPMLWLWIFGSVAEVVALELVLRSIDATWAEVVRLPLLLLGIWGAFWMLGLAASFRVRRHLLLPDRLVVRDGPRFHVGVPLAAVTGARLAEHEFEGTLRRVHEEDGLLLVAPANRTNVEIALAGPTALDGLGGPRTADRVGLWVDEPRELVRLLGDRVRTT